MSYSYILRGMVAYPRSNSSVGILIYGWAIFQSRLTRISARDGTSFDVLLGPMLICAALFIAILANFVFRVQESHKHTGVNPLSVLSTWEHAGTKGLWKVMTA